jgi:hypothetical protein
MMKYDTDPVVEEMRKTRKTLFARCGNDVKRYGEYIAAQAQKRKMLAGERTKAAA